MNVNPKLIPCTFMGLVVTAIQGLIDAADEQLNGQDKQRATSDTETDSNKVRDLQRVRHGNP